MKALIGSLSITAAFCITGCSGLRPYNKEADQIATAAKADYDAAKVAEALKGQHGVLDALEQKEVEAFHKLTIAQRDLDLLSLIESNDRTKDAGTVKAGFVYGMTKKIDARLAELDGGPTGRLEAQMAMQNARSSLEPAELNYRKAQYRVSTFTIGTQVQLPDCSDAIAALAKDDNGGKTIALLHAEENAAERIKVFWKSGLGDTVAAAANSCANLLKVRAAIGTYQPAGGSLLARATRDHQAISDALDKQTVAAKQQNKALAAAAVQLAAANQKRKAAGKLNDYSCPTASPSASQPAPAADDDADTAAATKKICGILDALAQLGDAGVQEVAEAKLARIRALLAALSGVPPAKTDGEVNESLALVSATTRLGRALDQYQRSSTLPALEPLVIEKQLADAQLSYASAGLKLQARRLAYAKDKVEAVVLEIALLNQAKSEMTLFGAMPDATWRCGKETIFCDSIEGMLVKNQRNVNKTPVYRTAYRALNLFAESYAMARDRQMEADVRIVAVDYQDSLIRSEAAVASWRAIIDTPVAQIKDYHALGWKPETLAALLQALGVIGIAVK